jgi:hypothetical protein
VRAKLGLSAEDDPFFGLIHVSDPRERARLSEFDFYGHSVMQLSAKEYPELEIWAKIAEMEDIYSITIDGEQRKEAILMRQSRAEQPSPLTIQLPQVETKPPEQEQKKKGWFRKE